MPRLLSFIAIILCSLFIGVEKTGLFFAGEEVASSYWTVESHQETVNPNSSRQSQIRNGSLHIGYYAFGRADRLTWSNAPLQNLQLQLAAGSTPVQLELIHNKRYNIELTTNQWRYVHEQQWQDYTAPWQASLITSDPVQLEITTLHNNSNLRSLTADGVSIDYEETKPQPWTATILIGSLLALAFLCTKRWSLRGLILAPLALPLYGHWSTLIEALRLTQTTDWMLARICLGFTCLPALYTLLIFLLQKRSLPKAKHIWFMMLGLCLLFSEHHWLQMLIGSGIILSHLLVTQRQAIEEDKWLWDAPLLLLPIFFGWGTGLVLLLFFRWALVLYHLPYFLEKHPKTGADYVFILFILLPISIEWGLRDTYLQETWSPEALEGQQVEWENWKNPYPYWQETCGDQQDAKGVLYVGGSSTGGAYQFADDPEAFFAGQIHKSLCQQFPLHSHNYGNSDRDTHTISRTIEQMLDATQANLIVLYVGHNDFGGNNPYTRRERESRENSILVSIGKKARQLRIIAGFDLLFRHLNSKQQETLDGPPIGPDGQVLNNQLMGQSYPYAVPLEDAQKNLWQIANIASKRGVKCLLVAQYISVNAFSDLSDYWEMEKQLAEAHPNLWFIDPRKDLEAYGEQAILADNNHLSRKGHRELGKALQQQIKDLLTP